MTRLADDRRKNRALCLWVPAFAGTTAKSWAPYFGNNLSLM